MKLRLLFPGRIKPVALAPAEAEYAGRLRRFGVEIAPWKEVAVSGRTPDEIRRMEAERVRKLLNDKEFFVVCDERGRSLRTTELADRLRAARRGEPPFTGRRRMSILIGGALGVDESLRREADEIWALSSLVLAGGVARVVLLEALYRAFTLIEGHPYHNE